MLLHCEYSRTPFNCTTKFRKILTDDGLCCIFNGVSRRLLITQAYKLVANICFFFGVCILSANTIFSSYSEEFDDENEEDNRYANLWTPEKGFESLALKSNVNSWPRPGVGNRSQNFHQFGKTVLSDNTT